MVYYSHMSLEASCSPRVRSVSAEGGGSWFPPLIDCEVNGEQGRRPLEASLSYQGVMTVTKELCR